MNQPQIPESRVYRHEKCNSETVVSGQAFEALSDPLSDMSRTWCSACGASFPLSDYVWADTGERITDYYSRHGAGATRVERFLCSRAFLVFCLVVGFVAGATLGFSLFRNNGWLLMLLMTAFTGVVGLIVLGSLKEFLLGKLIVRRVCGVRDSRMLK